MASGLDLLDSGYVEPRKEIAGEGITALIGEADRPSFESKLKELIGAGKSDADALREAQDFIGKSSKSGLSLLAPVTEVPAEKVNPDVSTLAHGLKQEDLRERDPLAKFKDTAAGAAMREFLMPSVEEFDRMKLNPIVTSKEVDAAATTLKGYERLATQPLEIVRGGAEFLFSLPGFALGILGAGQKMLERMGRPFTLNDLYKAASGGMNEMITFWGEKMVEPLLGKPTPESQLVGQTAMAPALMISTAVGNFSNAFNDFPNVQGVLRFAGDVGGLVALGRIYKGDTAELTAKSEAIVNKAQQIASREQMLNQIPDEAVRRAQAEILVAEKTQLELEAAEIQKNLNYGKMIEEDLKARGRIAAKAKITQKQDVDFQINRALEKIKEVKENKVKEEVKPEKKVKEKKVKEAKAKTGAELLETAEKEEVPETDTLAKIAAIEKETGKTIDKLTDDEAASALARVMEREETGIDWFGEGEAPAPRSIPEIGYEAPSIAEAFRDTPEKTSQMKNMYEGLKSVAKSFKELRFPDEFGTAKSIETTTNKLINDVNRSLDGEDVIDLPGTRNFLSELAARADEFKGEFPDPNSFRIWKETVSEAAAWARKADRSKIEPSIDLNMMIPVDKIPGMVKDVLKDLNVKAKDIFRNEELWKRTGFWFAQDGKWRYEIDEGKMKYHPGNDARKAYAEKGLGVDSITDALDYPELYKAMPELKDLLVFYDKSIKDDAYYNGANAIRLKRFGDKKALVHELQHAINTKAGSRFKGTGTPDDFKYLTNTGEMESRLAESRMNMSAAERAATPPWETLDTMLGWEKFTKDMRIGKQHGMKLYSGLPLDAIAKELVDSAKKLRDYTAHARGIKQFKPLEAAQLLRAEFNKAFVDRSGNIRTELLDKLGDQGHEIVQKMYLSKGASSLSANMLNQMRKEVYDGLSKHEKQVLDNLILADRMVDIGKYKTKKQFNFPSGLDPKSSIAYKELFEQIEKLTPEQAKDLKVRAMGYFEWMKKPLSDMLEAGLISKEEFDLLAAHNYRKIKLADVFDNKYVTKLGKHTRTVYDSGIEALARGRETDVFEPSSEIMALEVFNRAYGRIMNNRANQALLDLARSDKENPFVRVKEAKGDRIPSGWNRIYVFEEGTRKPIYLSPEMSAEWITNNPDISYRLGQVLRYASGSPVLRTFATGINWGFALANLPRDIMHSWFAARQFENGKWKPVFSPNLPVFALQMARDQMMVFRDALLKKGRYEDYIKDGGGMEFLVHQGRLFQRGRHLEGSIDKLYNVLGFFGETSEIMTRLAIREQAIRNGKSPQEATFIARDYMDFGQGGGIAKAADNALPYLNAAIQGTRGLVRSLKPGSGSALESTYKLAQFAAVTTGLYIAMQKMAPDSSKALKGNIDMQNNMCIPLGDDFGFEDEKGQMRYPYFKIPLDPGQKFFKKFFEASADKWLGNEVDVNAVVDSLKELSPVGVTELPPTISGALGYVTNKDFWLNEDIWRKTDKPFSYPQSREEFIPGQTPEMFKDIGQMTGLSPERMKYAVEELTTNGTIWSYLLGEGYDRVFGDLPASQKERHWAMVLSQFPGAKRFIGVTNPYSQYATGVEKAKEESDVERWVQNRGLDVRAEGYLFDKTVKREEVFEYMKSFKDKDVYDRLYDRFKYQEAIKDLDNKSFWLRLKGLNTEARAKVYVDRLNKSNEVEKEKLRNELGVVMRAGGVVTPEFREEVMKLSR